jgi:hypothetical protein
MPAHITVPKLFGFVAAVAAVKAWRNIQQCMRTSALQLAMAAMVLHIPIQAQAFTKLHCRERWFDHSVSGSNLDAYQDSECVAPSATFKPLGEWYWLADGKAYFRTVRTEDSRACAGRGPGALGNLLDPRCYLPSGLQRHDHYETRSFWLASPDGAHFRLAPTRQPQPHSRKMTMALQRYGVDGRTAYYDGEELVGADAKTFEVIFPFEHDESLRDYEFAVDANHLFINEWTLQRFDPSRIEWLVVPCAKDLKTLLPERCQESLVRSLGRIGEDLLYMSRSARPTLFKGLAEPDLHCEEVARGFQCVSRRRTFLIRVDYPEPPTVESMTEQQVRQQRHR